MLAASILCIIVVLYAIHIFSESQGTPIMLALARLLRRAGRWLWAAGEGLEHGYRHSQHVRKQISLDLEVR